MMPTRARTHTLTRAHACHAGNLEKYSKLDTDLSNLSLPAFESQYKTLLKVSCDLLKDGGYIGIVTGNFLNLDKSEYQFSRKTEQWIEELLLDLGDGKTGTGMVSMAGVTLQTPYGTAQMRSEKNGQQGRVTRVTQKLSVFMKKTGKYVGYDAPDVYKELKLSTTSECNSQEN